MKRLLLAPLILALTSCSNNITIKEDFVEKFIIESSKIKKKSITIEEIKKVLSGKGNENIAQLYLSGRIGSGGSFAMERIAYNQKEAVRRKSNYYKYESILEKHPDNKIVLYEVTFTPVFQDINKVKKISYERKIFCRSKNPSLKEIANIYLNYEYENAERRFIKSNKFNKKICRKYYL